MANALVDVVTGAVDPGGRLPTTLPLLLSHNPSYGNFPGANGEVRYREGISRVIGGTTPVSCPTFCLRTRTFVHDVFHQCPGSQFVDVLGGSELNVRVTVTNTGKRRGSHVVQCYVAAPVSRLDRPVKELKAFDKGDT